MSKIQIYLFDDFSGLGEGFVRENFIELPFFRQERCDRYRRDSDKRACIISYRLLKKGLREQYGLETSGEFIYSRYGKPYLKDHPGVFFNLSHCKNGVTCALADVEVGVDIQDIRPFSIDIARRVCSESELRELSVSGDPARLFCRIWTEKESYAKAEGISVYSVLKRDLPGSPTAYRETADYCMTLHRKKDAGGAVDTGAGEAAAAENPGTTGNTGDAGDTECRIIRVYSSSLVPDG